MSNWEKIFLTKDSKLSRFKVDGGHIYALNAENENHSQMNTAMCFVPDVDLTRYQSHLRDAYTQGFNDGVAETKAKYHLNPQIDPEL